jgi:hypothetical protein
LGEAAVFEELIDEPRAFARSFIEHEGTSFVAGGDDAEERARAMRA